MDTIFQKTLIKLETLLAAGQHGRSIELASGFGLWLVAMTLLFSSYYGPTVETLQIQNLYWAWASIVVGFAQLVYVNLFARMFMDILAAAIWLTIALYSYFTYGDWNIATAACAAIGIFNFYIYGFIFMECKK